MLILEVLPKSKKACNLEKAIEAVVDWWTPFIEHGRLPVDLAKI